ncbi:hypothetical protein CKAH01_18570 [Colletotrichum kahawae]|uniref:Uncharacterized protein n=1 Tax=Colletotrichum kahawae TaxID=34407 RepID=A0AAD9Y4Z6_COLKA|nr:hypothetical protein CKAH01_18570 [Colletotrichum kahawae]
MEAGSTTETHQAGEDARYGFVVMAFNRVVVVKNTGRVVTTLGACAGEVVSQARGRPQSDFRDSTQDRNKMTRLTMAEATHRWLTKTRGKACLRNTDVSIIVISRNNMNRKVQCLKRHPNVASTMTN